MVLTIIFLNVVRFPLRRESERLFITPVQHFFHEMAVLTIVWLSSFTHLRALCASGFHLLLQLLLSNYLEVEASRQSQWQHHTLQSHLPEAARGRWPLQVWLLPTRLESTGNLIQVCTMTNKSAALTHIFLLWRNEAAITHTNSPRQWGGAKVEPHRRAHLRGQVLCLSKDGQPAEKGARGDRVPQDFWELPP